VERFSCFGYTIEVQEVSPPDKTWLAYWLADSERINNWKLDFESSVDVKVGADWSNRIPRGSYTEK